VAVKIRLTRLGRKKRPFYRIIVLDERKRRDGAYLDKIGTYDPVVKPRQIIIDHDLALKWLNQGAQLSDTVKNLFRFDGVMLRWDMSKRDYDQVKIEEAVKEHRGRNISKIQSKVDDLNKVEQAKKDAVNKAAEEAEKKAQQEAQAAKKKADDDAKAAEDAAAETVKEEAPAKEAKAEEAPAEAPAEEAKAEEAPAEEAKTEEAPAEAPAEEAKVEEAPAEEVKAEESAAEVVEETPAEEAPAEGADAEAADDKGDGKEKAE